MNSHALIIVTFGIAFLIPVTLHAEGRSNSLASAVDAHGIRHQPVVWWTDAVKTVKPTYPYSERLRRHTGSGLLRLTLDLKTGSVIKIAVLKSIGYPALDAAVVAAFRQWKWKPGKWKEIDVPVTFSMTVRPFPPPR